MATTAETFTLACQYRAEGNLSLAEEFAWTVLSAEPNHAAAWQLFGRIARQKGDFEQAITHLNRSLVCDGANADTWAHLGDMRLATGDLRAGIANYEQALRLRPDSALVYTNLGIGLQHLGEWERAGECFGQAILLEPA